MAARLSEDPANWVLLIEAGPDYPDFERLPDEVKFGFATATDIITKDHNWEFVGRATDTAPPMRVPRGRVTGGSSAINGQMFLRGVPEDYDAWAAMGNDQWDFQKVLPYLRMIETDTEYGGDDFHNSDGPIIARRFPREGLMPEQRAFYDAALAAGFPDSPDQNHPEAGGVGPSPLNNPTGIRWSTALGYLDPARHRLNLTIRPNTLARRILFDGKRATGVEVESGGERFVVEGEEIILSASAINSPHLLMLSGVGPGRPATGPRNSGGPRIAGGGPEPARPSLRAGDVPHEAGARVQRARPQAADDDELDRRGLPPAQRHDLRGPVSRHGSLVP